MIEPLLHNTTIETQADLQQRIVQLQKAIPEPIDPLDQVKDVRWYLNWLEHHPEFEQQYPEDIANFKYVLADAMWMAFSALSLDEVLLLFEEHLGQLFSIHKRYDFGGPYERLATDILGEKLRWHLVSIENYIQRDAYKVELLKAMKGCSQVLTTADYFEKVKAGTPSVQNWLHDYQEAMEVNNKFSQYLHDKFLSKDDNMRLLDDEQRGWVKTLIELYEQLRVSSTEFEGNENRIEFEEPGRMGYVVRGQVFEYDKDMVKTIQQLQAENKASQGVSSDNGELPSRPPVSQLSDTLVNPDTDPTNGPDHFTDEDEADINYHREVSEQLRSAGVPNYSNQAKALIAQQELVFTTPELEKKFTDLLVSVLRGLRDVMEFQSYLVEMDYSDKVSNTIITAVKEELAKTATKKQSTSAVNTSERLTAIGGLASTATNNNATTVAAVPGEDAPRSSFAAKPRRRSLLPKLRRSRRARKPLIDDVKLQESMVMGPVEELRAIDVIEFRRLASNPTMAASKIKDKVELLGEQSVTRQTEGVEAFKQSPLNSLYVEVGNVSMTNGKPVADVIAELDAQSGESLSLEEFNAIADLNRQLRF